MHAGDKQRPARLNRQTKRRASNTGPTHSEDLPLGVKGAVLAKTSTQTLSRRTKQVSTNKAAPLKANSAKRGSQQP